MPFGAFVEVGAEGWGSGGQGRLWGRAQLGLCSRPGSGAPAAPPPPAPTPAGPPAPTPSHLLPAPQVLPKREGLLHVSEWSRERVANVADVVKEGDLVDVMITELQARGLSAGLCID